MLKVPLISWNYEFCILNKVARWNFIKHVFKMVIGLSIDCVVLSSWILLALLRATWWLSILTNVYEVYVCYEFICKYVRQ